MSQEFVLPKGPRSLTKLMAFLSSLSAMKAWRVTICEERNSRSIQQCRYLNGVAYKAISDATGYERDDVSEFCCGQYFGWRNKKVPKKPGNLEGIEQVPVRTTTTDESGKRNVMSTVDFMDYVAFVQRFAASKGIYIPDPGEEFEQDLEKVA